MLTQARLFKRLHYCPSTGVFTHIAPIGKSQWIPPGTIAGTTTKFGYQRIAVHGSRHMAHRLAWFYVFGKWPDGLLDHINGSKLDNRICNLRIVSRSVNGQNTISCRSNNSSGLMGATWRPRQGWVSQIGLNNKQYVLGYFDSAEEAHIMYLMAKLHLHDTSALQIRAEQRT